MRSELGLTRRRASNESSDSEHSHTKGSHTKGAGASIAESFRVASSAALNSRWSLIKGLFDKPPPAQTSLGRRAQQRAHSEPSHSVFSSAGVMASGAVGAPPRRVAMNRRPDVPPKPDTSATAAEIVGDAATLVDSAAAAAAAAAKEDEQYADATEMAWKELEGSPSLDAALGDSATDPRDAPVRLSMPHRVHCCPEGNTLRALL